MADRPHTHARGGQMGGLYPGKEVPKTDDIPANSTLVYTMELVKIERKLIILLLDCSNIPE